jgi:hypothetical protein
VIKVENFEVSSVSALSTRWTTVYNAAGMSLVSDRPSASSGTRALRMNVVGGSSTAAQLYTPLPEDESRVFVRYYVKYAANHIYHHSGLWMGGYNPLTNAPQGGAGIKPDGDDLFSLAVEPAPDLRFDTYAYWMRMRPQGSSYWGNRLIYDPNLRTPYVWTCVEVMIDLNDPLNSYNGELAVWIDGEPIVHLGQGFPNGRWVGPAFQRDPSGAPFEGMQWRNHADLANNWVWLNHYVTGLSSGSVSSVWFDDLVVATEYIGPIALPEPGAVAQLGTGMATLLLLARRRPRTPA